MLQAAGASVTVRPTSVTVCRPSGCRSARSRCRGISPRPRRSSSRRRSIPAPRSTSTASTSTRAAPASSTILERMGANITVYNRRSIGGEPGGDLKIHSAPLVGDDRRSDGGAARDRRAPALRARGRIARGESVLRGAEELRAKETDRIEATVDALRSLGARARAREDGFAITGVPRGSAAAGSRAAATTVSRCSGRRRPRVAGGSPHRGRGRRGSELPRVLRDGGRLRRPQNRQGHRHGALGSLPGDTLIVAIDGPARRRQELRCPGARRAARFSLPRHGRDVPRTDVARVARGRPARRGPDLEELARTNPVDAGRARARLRRGGGVTTPIREPGSTRPSRS